jgi:hypothetical protein
MRARAVAERSKQLVAGAIVLTAIVGAASVLQGDGAGTNERWMFLDPATLADLGLAAHGAGGAWGLETHEEATGGRALANHEGEPGAEPAVLVASRSRARDLRARTRCEVVGVSMRADSFASASAACGIVFRFVDARNHWIARADVSDSTLEVVTVIDGRERVVGRAEVAGGLVLGSWIELGVEVRGDVVRVGLGGRPLVVAQTPAVPAAFGAVGLWATSESTVFFDHFTIETLTPAPQALEILPILGRRSG